jgi:hypothetical protein
LFVKVTSWVESGSTQEGDGEEIRLGSMYCGRSIFISSSVLAEGRCSKRYRK